MLETQPFDARVRLPEPLAHLRELALNLRWTWDRETRALFQEIYPDLWNSHIYNPWLVLLAKDDQGFLITDDKMETHIPGLYVCGDVRSQYVRQISNAVGDATIAAVAATRYIEELDATDDPLAAETVERLLVDA